jgi:hypothetical protein
MRRRSWESRMNTSRTLNVRVGTVKKLQAAVTDMCRDRKDLHVSDGGLGARTTYLATVNSATS